MTTKTKMKQQILYKTSEKDENDIEGDDDSEDNVNSDYDDDDNEEQWRRKVMSMKTTMMITAKKCK